MRLSILTNVERWEWFAAGDPSVAPKIVRSSFVANSPSRVMFEAGLVVLVPLVLAVATELLLAN